jgi:hypothetical protein
MTRYDELVSLLFDAEPTDSELEELAQLLRNDERLAADFQKQLLIWDVWAQDAVPERSAKAFEASFQTRLRAEADADTFSSATAHHLQRKRRLRVLLPILAAAAMLTVMLTVFFLQDAHPENTEYTNNQPAIAPTQQISIVGECVCTRCTLGIEGKHNDAIRYVDQAGQAQLVLLTRNPKLKNYKKAKFCRGPNRIYVEGEMIEENGQQLLAASSISFPKKNFQK